MTTNNQHPQIEEIDLLDYIKVILNHRKMVIRNSVLIALIAAVISFLLPKTYTAETTLLPPDESQQNSLLTAFSGMPFSQLGFQQPRSTSELFVRILQSRTVFDHVLHTSFKIDDKKTAKPLMEMLKCRSIARARKTLAKAVSVSANPEGIISIKVELGNPRLAAGVANTLVAELDKVNTQKYTSRAKNSRVYIEQQLQQTEKKLKEAADSLALFKQQYKAIALEEQTKTAIEKAGEIKGNIIAKDVELGVALQTMKPDNVYIIKLKKEIEELNKQYQYIQYGDEISFTEKQEFFVPFSEVPGVGLQLAILTRNVKVQETVWELLNQQFYQAKIQEARDTPTVQVLDEAIPPEFRTKPNRKLLVLVSGFLAFILSIFWAFVKEYFIRLKAEQGEIAVLQELGRDFNRLKMNTKQKALHLLRRHQ